MSHFRGSMQFAQFDRQYSSSVTTAPPFLSHYAHLNMADPSIAQPRQQQNSYPSPHSYPSPSLAASYAYQTQQAQSPPAQTNALPGMNTLPPIRAMDGQGQQQQPQPQQQSPPAPPHQQAQPPQPQYHPPMQQHMGSPMPQQHQPPQQVAPMSAYYQQPGPPPPGAHMGASPHNMAGMRYPLPAGPQNPNMLPGRHKKEIKRRTKTGCLTCRKRRIKCDEAHPICRNCQKSKRECLGYDPIFKQQPGPQTIQPAPSAAQPTQSIPAPAPPAPAMYSNIPQGYAPAASAGYAPPMGTSNSPGSALDPSFGDYAPAIDPALAGGEAGDAKTAMGTPSPYPSHTTDGHMRAVKRIAIDDLLALRGIPPPQIPKLENIDAVSQELKGEVRTLFEKDYGPGLDKFLETKWYTTSGLSRLMNDVNILSTFAHFLGQCRIVQSDNHEGMQQLASIEAKLVWDLLSMCRAASSAMTNGTNGTLPHDNDLKEVLQRLDIFENMITMQYMDPSPFHQPVPYSGTHKYYEEEFWRNLGSFVSHRPVDPPSMSRIDTALFACRNILMQLENRDVLYSMAVIRHFGPTVPEFPEGIHQPMNDNDADPRTKLAVAKTFIMSESDKGTTQVIQRLCGMFIESWKSYR